MAITCYIISFYAGRSRLQFYWQPITWSRIGLIGQDALKNYSHPQDTVCVDVLHVCPIAIIILFTTNRFCLLENGELLLAVGFALYYIDVLVDSDGVVRYGGLCGRD
jgi:hypothetical protein